MRLKFGSYYIVDVAHSKHNVIHRAIAYNYRAEERRITIMGGGYTKPDVLIDNLPHFHVVRELVEMRETTQSDLLTPTLRNSDGAKS